jgi:hypothetical protein
LPAQSSDEQVNPPSSGRNALTRAAAHAGAEAILLAASAVAASEAVAKRAGLTNRKGRITPFKLAWKVSTSPTKTARAVLDAAAQEAQARRSTDS